MRNIIVGRYGPNEGSIELEPDPHLKAAADFEAVCSTAALVETRDGVVYADGVRVGTVRRRWAGWLEPEDKTWIAFIREEDGVPVFYLNRDPETGAVLDHLGGPRTVDDTPV